MAAGEGDWKDEAYERQLRYFQTLGVRSYDEIPKKDLFQLKKKVGYATCGPPGQLPEKPNFFTGYDEEQLRNIGTICKIINDKSSDNGKDFNKFACFFLIIYYKKKICETPVFRIEIKSGTVFIDTRARVYSTWQAFQKNNKLPNCEYCYPLDGFYKSDRKGNLLLGFTRSPASTLARKAIDGLDTVGAVVSVGAAGVAALSLGVAVAPAALTAAAGASVSAGVYGISRSIYSLVDRKKHEQTLGLKDSEARAAWMSVATSTVSFGSAGAVAKAQKVVESGKSLSRLGLFGLRALNTSSLIFCGFGFVDTFVTCYDKHKKGILTPKDVFDLSCELLFLFNAAVSVKATNEFIKNMNVAVGEPTTVQKKLTKTQKRNLQKKNAKRRAKGLAPVTSNQTEVTNKTEESNSNIKYTQVIVQLFQVAARECCPRLWEVLYDMQSMGHDIMCWKRGDISDLDLINNLFRKAYHLWEKYSNEIEEVLMKVVDYFSVIDDEVNYFICSLFETSTNEQQADFCTQLNNMEDLIETAINDAERGVSELEQTESTVEITEITDEDNMNDEESELNCGAKDVFQTCVRLIGSSSLTCSNLQGVGDLMEGLKYTVVEELKEKMNGYFKNVKAAREQAGQAFDLEKYNKSLGIQGDVVQYMFKEIINSASAAKMIYKMRIKCEEIKSERSGCGVPVWEATNDNVNVIHLFGKEGKGHFSKSELLSHTRDIVKMRLKGDCPVLTEDNCKFLENKEGNFVMIDIQVSDKLNVQVVVYKELNLENTASMMIYIYV